MKTIFKPMRLFVCLMVMCAEGRVITFNYTALKMFQCCPLACSIWYLFRPLYRRLQSLQAFHVSCGSYVRRAFLVFSGILIDWFVCSCCYCCCFRWGCITYLQQGQQHTAYVPSASAQQRRSHLPARRCNTCRRWLWLRGPESILDRGYQRHYRPCKVWREWHGGHC